MFTTNVSLNYSYLSRHSRYLVALGLSLSSYNRCRHLIESREHVFPCILL
jgi:hypothetical protein